MIAGDSVAQRMETGNKAGNLAMEHMDPEQLERTRRNLLKYCELDTCAMVKIWEKLREAAGEL